MPGSTFYPDISAHTPAFSLLKPSVGFLYILLAARKAGRIFAVGFEEAIYLKRIDMLPGKVILKSVNEECYPPVELSVSGDLGEQFRVIGQVLWSGREYR